MTTHQIADDLAVESTVVSPESNDGATRKPRRRSRRRNRKGAERSFSVQLEVGRSITGSFGLVALAPDGRLAAADEKGDITLFSPEADYGGETLAIDSDHRQKRISSLTFFQDSLYAGLNSGELVRVINRGQPEVVALHNKAISDVRILEQGIWTASHEGFVTFWDHSLVKKQSLAIPSWQTEPTFQRVTATALLPGFNDSRVIIGCGDGRIRVFNAGSGHLYQEVQAHRGGVTLLVVDREHGHVVSGGRDGMVRLWRLTSQKNMPLIPVGAVRAHGSCEVRGLAILDSAPRSTLVVSSGRDGALRTWNLAAESRMLSEQLIEGSCAGLAVLKERGVIAVSSSNSIQLFGYTLGEAVTDPIVEAGE